MIVNPFFCPTQKKRHPILDFFLETAGIPKGQFAEQREDGRLTQSGQNLQEVIEINKKMRSLIEIGNELKKG